MCVGSFNIHRLNLQVLILLNLHKFLKYINALLHLFYFRLKRAYSVLEFKSADIATLKLGVLYSDSSGTTYPEDSMFWSKITFSLYNA